MKVSDCYIYEIKDITAKAEKLNAGGLFYAYERLTYIETLFDIYKIPGNDESYQSLIDIKRKVKLLLTDKLRKYDDAEKRLVLLGLSRTDESTERRG